MVLKSFTRWYGNAFNDRVSSRLRSPAHGSLSRNHLLISFHGRKSKKRYTIPVNYRRTPEGSLVIGTEAAWWHNLEGGAQVDLVVAGEEVTGYATPITDEPERREQLGRMLTGFTWSWFSKSLVIVEITVR